MYVGQLYTSQKCASMHPGLAIKIRYSFLTLSICLKRAKYRIQGARDMQRSARKHFARDVRDNDVTRSEDRKNAPALT